jgi:hypothetical protein
MSTSALSPSVLIIVRRGRADRFWFLEWMFAHDPAEVIWDRRVGERRQRGASRQPDRRREDRRGASPASWSVLDFVVAPRADAVTDTRWGGATR